MLLRSLVKALCEEFGFREVIEEADSQYGVQRVSSVAAVYPDSPHNMISRARTARTLFDMDLEEAKEWVKARFSDNGNGDPVY